MIRSGERQCFWLHGSLLLQPIVIHNDLTSINISNPYHHLLSFINQHSGGTSSQKNMADYGYGGSDEENAELKKLNAEVVSLRNQHLHCEVFNS